MLKKVVLVFGLVAAGNVYADTPEQILEDYAAEARAVNSSFTGFSAEI